MTTEFIQTFLKDYLGILDKMTTHRERTDQNLHALLNAALKKELINVLKTEDFAIAKEIAEFLRKDLKFKFLDWVVMNSPELWHRSDILFLPDEETVELMRTIPDCQDFTLKEYVTEQIQNIK